MCPHFLLFCLWFPLVLLFLYSVSLAPSPLSSWHALQSSLSCQIEPKIELGASCAPLLCGYMALVTLASWCFLLQLNTAEPYTSPLPAHGVCMYVYENISVYLQGEGASVSDTPPQCLRFNCQVSVWQHHPGKPVYTFSNTIVWLFFFSTTESMKLQTSLMYNPEVCGANNVVYLNILAIRILTGYKRLWIYIWTPC